MRTASTTATDPGSIRQMVSNACSHIDVNLDGTVKYIGANNDRDIILQTIGSTVPTAVRAGQLP